METNAAVIRDKALPSLKVALQASLLSLSYNTGFCIGVAVKSFKHAISSSSKASFINAMAIEASKGYDEAKKAD